MNAHTLRKWSPIKIFMYLLLAICSLLVFWCQEGASAMHLTPLDFSSFNLEHRRRHQHPEVASTTTTTTSSAAQNHFINLLRNTTINHHDKFSSLHYQHPQQQQQQQQQDQASSVINHHDLRLQKLWQTRMREKRARIQAHRKQKLLLQQLLDQRLDLHHNNHHESAVEDLKLSANPNLNINNLKHLINHNIITQHNHQQHNNNKLNHKLNTTTTSTTTTLNNDEDHQHRREELFETLNEIMANISVASNRNRRESRFHHRQQQQMQLSSSSSSAVQLQNRNRNSNSNNNNNNNNPHKRKRYCSARDPKTLAFEAPTVFEGKVKSMTTDRQVNFSITVEVQRVFKQQRNFTVPKVVRLQFALKNTSECDIYREEFRDRGFVRDEPEQGKIYFLFVKQISLGNFTILGQPIRKTSRTAKDVEIGVSEKYGKRASIELMSLNQTVKEGKRGKISCKVDGEPAPKVTWFKDGRSINRNRTKYIFNHLRRRSDLIIKSVDWKDSGKYECRAKNKLWKEPVSQFAWLDVLSKHSPSTERTTKPLNGDMKECPNLGGNQFCLNGGKCLYFESLQEPSCICPEGFSGKNCEDKTPNITANFELADPFVLNPPVAPTSDYDDDDN